MLFQSEFSSCFTHMGKNKWKKEMRNIRNISLHVLTSLMKVMHRSTTLNQDISEYLYFLLTLIIDRHIENSCNRVGDNTEKNNGENNSYNNGKKPVLNPCNIISLLRLAVQCSFNAPKSFTSNVFIVWLLDLKMKI